MHILFFMFVVNFMFQYFQVQELNLKLSNYLICTFLFLFLQINCFTKKSKLYFFISCLISNFNDLIIIFIYKFYHKLYQL